MTGRRKEPGIFCCQLSAFCPASPTQMTSEMQAGPFPLWKPQTECNSRGLYSSVPQSVVENCIITGAFCGVVQHLQCETSPTLGFWTSQSDLDTSIHSYRHLLICVTSLLYVL